MKIKKSIFSILLSIILLLATSLPCFAYAKQNNYTALETKLFHTTMN